MAPPSPGGREMSAGAPEQSTCKSQNQEQSAPASSELDGGEGTPSVGTSAKNEDAGDGMVGEGAKSLDATERNNAEPTKPDKAKPPKIKVHLVAVGSAPILKKSKFLMNADDRFAVAIAFLRKVLKLSSGGGTGGAAASSLFLYVNAAFVPSPDERLGDLFDCFGIRGELVIHYALQEAWG